MTELEKFLNTPKNTLNVDWSLVEKKIGFEIHENIKDFYSRIVCDEKFGFRGRMRFIREKFIKSTGNKDYDNFLFTNSYTNDWDAEGNDTSYYLTVLRISDLDDLYEAFYKVVNPGWVQIDDFGCRVYIGRLGHRRGNVDLFINNDTGQFEWIYLERNHSNIYEENPNGLVADDIDEFLKKFLK